MTEDKLREKYEVYTECWKFFRKFCVQDDSDSFWEKLTEEKDKLQDKMDSPLFRGIMLETVREIERIQKEGA